MLPTNLTLYQSISKHLPKNASVYLSNKRPYILIEQAENWTVSSIKYLFGSGIYKFDKKMAVQTLVVLLKSDDERIRLSAAKEILDQASAFPNYL